MTAKAQYNGRNPLRRGKRYLPLRCGYLRQLLRRGSMKRASVMDWFYDSYPDFDFWFLLRVLKHVDPRGGLWLNAQVLRELVDWQDEQGDLWRYVDSVPLALTCLKPYCDRWGPKGFVRRRISTWPPPSRDHDRSSSSSSDDSNTGGHGT